MKILMLKGLPGSGKSTWAKTFVEHNHDWIRVNKDSLRAMMGSYRPGKDEELILRWRDNLIMAALRRGKNVIVDDTNFHPKHEERLKNIIYGEQGLEDPLFICDFEIKTFDTPVDECIKNDLKRAESVGEKVIRKMWHQYVAPRKAEKPEHLTGHPHAIIVDIDGTVATHVDRSPYDTEKCSTDVPNDPVVAILRTYDIVDNVIFVSGREDKYRELTETWLKTWGIRFDALYMRPTGDHRRDDVVKQEIYDQNILGKYNVHFVLDDRDRVVNMWRRNGLTCLQVAEGDF